MDAIDDIAFLAGSRERAAVLAALEQEGGLPKDGLVERCDAARVTVSRNLERLADRGYVRADGDHWRLTPLGELVAGEFLALADSVGTAGELEPVLRRLTADAFDLDPSALAGARVTESTAASPYAPAERHAETLLAAERARMVLPAISAQSMRDTRDPIVRGALSLELVVAPSVARTFRTDLADLVGDLLATGNVTIHEAEGAVPFFLGLLDGTVQIGVSDDEGIPRALAETDAEPVFSWAETRFESALDAAVTFALDRTDD